MSVIDIFEYRRTKARIEELEEIIEMFAFIAEILYSNLQYRETWKTIEYVEDVLYESVMQHEIYKNIIKQKENHVEN